MTGARPIRVVIADDEPLVRSGLRADLASEPDVEIVGEAADGLEALTRIEEARPDLVLLDVQMPGLDGFEVLERLEGDPPAVVFVTAFDAYALRAFDVHALDYLLKPFDRARLASTIDRARRELARPDRPGAGRLKGLIAETSGRRIDRFVVRQIGRIVIVPADQVEWIEARGNYVLLHHDGGELLERRTLADAARALDPTRFVRVHRSAIVRVDAVVELVRVAGGDHRMRLASGAEITLSRGYRADFERALGRPL